MNKFTKLSLLTCTIFLSTSCTKVNYIRPLAKYISAMAISSGTTFGITYYLENKHLKEQEAKHNATQEGLNVLARRCRQCTLMKNKFADDAQTHIATAARDLLEPTTERDDIQVSLDKAARAIKTSRSISY